MTRTRWRILFLFLALAAGAGCSRQEPAAEASKHEEQDAHAEAQETSGVVTLDAEALAQSGIVVAPREPSARPAPSRIPESAVVWLDGKPWIYVEEAPGHFVRREFEASRIAPDARVVISGAQMLLSQEFRAQIQVGEGGGGEEDEEDEEDEKK